jgi:hypothetical protein
MRDHLILFSCIAVLAAGLALAVAQTTRTAEMNLNLPSSPAPALTDSKLTTSRIEGANGVLFLDVRDSYGLAVTAYAIRLVGQVPQSVLLVAGTVSVKVSQGQFIGVMSPSVGAILSPEGVQIDCLDQVPVAKEIPPGASQRVLQLTGPLPDSTQVETTAVLYANGDSEGDAKAIDQILASRRRKLKAIPVVRQFLDGGGLAKTDPKSVDKKFRELETGQRRSNPEVDLRGVLEGVRRTISLLPKKATPIDTQQGVKAFLEGLETALKESKPALP